MEMDVQKDLRHAERVCVFAPGGLLRDPNRRPAYGRRGVLHLGKYRRTPVFTEKSSMYRQRPKLHASQPYSRVTK